MNRHSVLPVAAGLCIAAALAGADQTGTGPRQQARVLPVSGKGTLARDELQPIYAPDVNHPWNRIFHCLFTRTLNVRVSDEFKEAGPFESFRVLFGSATMPLSRQPVRRIESGDRAVEPLYPSDFALAPPGPSAVLDEPRFSRLRDALTEALAEKADHPPLARALMQSDAWAAHDILYRYGRKQEGEERRRCEQLLGLLARLIRKVALTPAEIEALPDNYAAAARAGTFPDLFRPEGGWLEIEWMPGRVHDEVSDFRRATRVFLKLASPPRDRRVRALEAGPLLHDLRDARDVASVNAVALVMQPLLIDTGGKVVPSHLTETVQVRTFVHKEGRLAETRLAVGEWSRQRLLADPRSDGFVTFAGTDPAYAGGDYGFASRLDLCREGQREPVARDPVLVTEYTHCAHCHQPALSNILTFQAHAPDPPPPVKVLDPRAQEHARFVAREKMKREDFKALRERWDRE